MKKKLITAIIIILSCVTIYMSYMIASAITRVIPYPIIIGGVIGYFLGWVWNKTIKK